MLFIGLLLLGLVQPAHPAVTDAWPALQASFFAGKTIVEDAKLIRLEAPETAENPALVPFAFSIDHPHVRHAWLLIDGNPVPMTATFHFLQELPEVHAEIRIRLDKSSLVRLVAEMADGKMYMAAVPVRTTGGGCGGGLDGDELKLRNEAGGMKILVDTPSVPGKPRYFTYLIKHPMRTGFERTTQGYYAMPWFINKLVLDQDGTPLLWVDLGVGVSADPRLRLPLLPLSDGTLKVTASDNEGKTFQQAFPLPGP